MADQQLHKYFALSLLALRPNHADLRAQLDDPQANLGLLLELHPFDAAMYLNNMFLHLNTIEGIAVRRAYFWLSKFCTDERLSYFLLQHPEAGDSLLPRAIADAAQMAYSGNFFYLAGEAFDIRNRDIERTMEPLYDTMKVLNNLTADAWWENEFELTHRDIDELVNYIRLATR